MTQPGTRPTAVDTPASLANRVFAAENPMPRRGRDRKWSAIRAAALALAEASRKNPDIALNERSAPSWNSTPACAVLASLVALPQAVEAGEGGISRVVPGAAATLSDLPATSPARFAKPMFLNYGRPRSLPARANPEVLAASAGARHPWSNSRTLVRESSGRLTAVGPSPPQRLTLLFAQRAASRPPPEQCACAR